MTRTRATNVFLDRFVGSADNVIMSYDFKVTGVADDLTLFAIVERKQRTYCCLCTEIPNPVAAPLDASLSVI